MGQRFRVRVRVWARVSLGSPPIRTGSAAPRQHAGSSRLLMRPARPPLPRAARDRGRAALVKVRVRVRVRARVRIGARARARVRSRSES